jgi:hypothetical protein
MGSPTTSGKTHIFNGIQVVASFGVSTRGLDLVGGVVAVAAVKNAVDAFDQPLELGASNRPS